MLGPVIITSCTHRKRDDPDAVLCARDLKPGTQKDVARDWLTRLTTKPVGGSRAPAEDLYYGRAFKEALLAAGTNPMYIVSAGLGLVPRDREIPAYSLTVSGSGADSIRTKICRFNKEHWWSSVSGSPFSSDLAKELYRPRRRSIVVALPLNYFAMFEQVLLSLRQPVIERLRIVGIRPDDVCESLRDQVMPFDRRLDGPDSPLKGTHVDFAQRYAHFLVEQILCDSLRSAREDARKVKRKIGKWRLPAPMPVRAAKSDQEIKQLIIKHWEDVGGRSVRMLRYLRDELEVACEQKRCGDLFRQVAEIKREGLSA